MNDIFIWLVSSKIVLIYNNNNNMKGYLKKDSSETNKQKQTSKPDIKQGLIHHYGNCMMERLFVFGAGVCGGGEAQENPSLKSLPTLNAVKSISSILGHSQCRECNGSQFRCLHKKIVQLTWNTLTPDPQFKTITLQFSYQDVYFDSGK